ncbi:MAG: DUF3881 family protein [bacterium]|nr:DUF3881 family protein [bacterium]
MHSFLRAVGFSEITKDVDLLPYIKMTIRTPDLRSVYEDKEGNHFVELKKEFGYRIGLAVCGSYQKNDVFHMEYFYPYFIGNQISTQESIEIERHADKNSYAGICDDSRLGITLIYYLQNIGDFMRGSAYSTNKSCCATTMLSALSTNGKIILPIVQTKEVKQSHENRLKNRTNLISAAREGDEEAIESLTMEDIDVYSMLSRRVGQEDLLSIVDTSMMPYGIESDQYAVIGEIQNVERSKNMITGEDVYVLAVNSKDILYDICINEKDLMGEPKVGRRFKGTIWMQGRVVF